ncbi:MAG: hydroxyacylglutathione hydrolase [Hydrotalea sp.]|nr:hydroxyacylglutathione hydrolase [Hydrotalea sp.]
MSLRWAQIPALADNYIYFIINDKENTAVVVDPGEAGAVINFLTTQQLTLEKILITHHHHDHVGGVVALQEKYHCTIYAPQYDIDKRRIPHLNGLPLTGLSEGDGVDLWGRRAGVIALAGHTLGHVGFYVAEEAWLFCGDVIFSLGCGFLFEGDFATAHESLQKINALPPATLLFMAHEYSAANIAFAKWFWGDAASPMLATRIDDIKKLRRAKKPTVPTRLSIEQATNPFLQMNNVADFKTLRETKNNFNAT